MEEETLNNEGADAYQAYVLRLWKDGEEVPWRASLEAVDTGNRHHFADLDRLIHFLQLATVSPQQQGESDVETPTESAPDP